MNYTYNVRSWTKDINAASLFSQSIGYDFAGNINSLQWTDNGKNRKYDFGYDKLSRLTTASFSGSNIGFEKYGTNYGYDKQGNVTYLERFGKTGNGNTASDYGLIDKLTIAYSGNQIKSASDTVVNVGYPNSDDFLNLTNSDTEYFFNKNGAVTKDLNKGISDIQYNTLNLPLTVDIKSTRAEARNYYSYTADGMKIKTVHKWNDAFAANPVIGSPVNTAALNMSRTTDYVGNKRYENGVLKTILLEGAYYDCPDGKYYFFIQDHLGSNRLVAEANSAVLQRNHYYPYGLSLAENSAKEAQPYKYNNKEMDAQNGLNLYDYEARYMDPALGRFTTIDPMAEKYYAISPYVYCANNPVKYMDPTGMDIWEIDKLGKIINHIQDKTQDAFFMVEKDKDGNYQRTYTTNKDGNKYYNGISFEYGTIESLKSFSFSPDGKTTDTYDVYQVRGDNNGSQLFEFMAQNTSVEWSQAKTGIEGDNGLNFLTTSHMEKSEHGMTQLYNGQLRNGYSIRELIHNHPSNKARPSGLDGKKGGNGDIGFCVTITNNHIKKHLNVPIFKIYTINPPLYIKYTSKSTKNDFK